MRYIIILAGMTMLMACSSDKEQVSGKETEAVRPNVITLTDTQLKNASLQTGMAQIRDISSVIKVSGKIEVPPQNMVSVSFPFGGFLKHTKLLPGMPVRKGEVIATMEDAQYIQLQQDYLTARVRQQYLEAEYLRQRELNQSKAASDKVYQQAEAEYNTSRILVSSLSQKLRLTGIAPDRLHDGNISRSVNVYAPIDGFVSRVGANIGKYVSPSDVLFELVNPTDIHLVLTVFEKDISRLAVGQRLEAYSNNSDKKYPCTIILIGHDVSEDRSIEVHCHFDRYDRTLVPGMYMNADIEVHTEHAAVVPEGAVVRDGNKQYVFAAYGNNAYEMKEVITGNAENGYVAVRAVDLDLSKQVIVTGNAYVLLMALKNKAE